MAPAVVLVLALLAPALSLPFTIPEYTPEIQIEQETPVSNNVPQIQPGVQEKTGVPVPSRCSAGYPVAVNEDVAQAVTRVQDAPVNVEQAQVPQTETLFLPPQPAPVTQVDQIVRPVIVPAEAIASGRVIIMAIEPIQQRAFPDVVVVPQQQPILSEIPIQQVQSVEKQTPYQENYSPVQPNSNVQQIVQANFNEVPQRQSQVHPESSQQQVYPERQAVEKEVNQPAVQVQPAQEQVVQQVEHVEKRIQSGADYTPVEQTAEPVQLVQSGADYTPVEHTAEPAQRVQSGADYTPVEQTAEPAQRVQSGADYTPVEQTAEPAQRVQSGADYTPVEQTAEPAQHVQSAEIVDQGHNVQQSIEKQSHENPQEVHVVPQQQVYTAQAVPENAKKQVECAVAQSQSEPQQRVNVQEASEQTQQEAKTHQQQTYSVQPEQVVQEIQSVEPQQEVHQVPQVHPVTKTENQQVHDVPQQVSTFATSQVYNFGDKIPQQHPVKTPVHQQQYVVEPVVVKDQ